MSYLKSKIGFEVLIDISFTEINQDPNLKPIKNKFLLSIVNDFEDGEWRYRKFQNFIWDNIAESALSKNERDSLINQSHSLLTAAAKNLRLTDKIDDLSKGSELAEIVLYGIMKYHYDALPVVPKIFYKQNSQDNAKGADSVHIVLLENNDFTLWFGEAKFFNSIEDVRLPAVINSVEESLRTEKLKKENSIVTNVSDIDNLIDDLDLREEIRNALSPKESIDVLKPKLHIPILLLHECQITGDSTESDENYFNEIKKHHENRARSYFKKQINKIGQRIHNYSSVNFHLILFPVPDKEKIVDQFVDNVEYYKGQ